MAIKGYMNQRRRLALRLDVPRKYMSASYRDI